jgi:hypothetical protein
LAHCEICHRSEDVTLWRMNAFGVDGIWRCTAHRTFTVESTLQDIVDVLEDYQGRKKEGHGMGNEHEGAWQTFLALHPMSDAEEDALVDFLVSEGFDPDDMPVSQLEVAWKAFQRRRDA